MAVVISLNRVLAPVDDTVTAHSKTQVTGHKSLMSVKTRGAGALTRAIR